MRLRLEAVFRIAYTRTLRSSQSTTIFPQHCWGRTFAWRIEVTPAAVKHLRKLDLQVARLIGTYLEELVTSCSDPLQRGPVLDGQLGGLWFPGFTPAPLPLLRQWAHCLGETPAASH